jgi:hypothetical protein
MILIVNNTPVPNIRDIGFTTRSSYTNVNGQEETKINSTLTLQTSEPFEFPRVPFTISAVEKGARCELKGCRLEKINRKRNIYNISFEEIIH